MNTQTIAVATDTPALTSPGRVPELDGLRGLAVLAVVVAHYGGEVKHGSRFLALGWLGVNVFFVLSGFLIGGILIDHRAASHPLIPFYVRRVCRILPAYFLTIGATFALLAGLGWPDWAGRPLPGWTYAAFLQNFWACLAGRDPSWLLPTWTLAVEEQFYLVLPAVVLILRPAWLPVLALAAIACAPVARGFLLSLSPPVQVGAHVLLPCRWDFLFWGVLAAVAVRSDRYRDLLMVGRALPLRVACLASFWGYVVLAWIGARTGLPAAHVLGLSLLALAGAAYVLLLLRNDTEGRFLRAPWLRFLGSISYGLYLCHQPINGLAHGLIFAAPPDVDSPARLAVTGLAAVASVAGAWCSWTCFEAPLVRFGHRWTYHPPTPEPEPEPIERRLRELRDGPGQAS